ncbi:MAG TPA: glycoside hydrolase family 27 protein [Steroidobacteraceae bacterium]|nr:glycoside hydrolase family 27 protein [Steroidobacteraceae bacterium]
MHKIVLLFALACLPILTSAADTPSENKIYKDESLARTPPMGWNSWNTFACDINEALIRETTDAMVSSGMRDAGYIYVNIDDCWHGQRDAQGFIQPDAKRFPSGMKALADYVHSKGMKIGIYSDAGEKTCGGHPGSQGHEFQDAMQYASWGIDYLKYDWCSTGDRNPVEAYRTMATALRATGRPIVFSICEWGDHKPWTWGAPIGHLWRTTGDITHCWDCVVGHGSWFSNGVMRILDKQEELRQYAGPGHWNDPDMMEVGNMANSNEDRAHFAMWAMLAAPLIAGNDVRNMSASTREILTNREVIAVDQDALGIQGFPAKKEAGVEIWAKPLANDEWAIAVLNRNADPRKVTIDWATDTIEDAQFHRNPEFQSHTYRLRNLISHATAGTTAQPLHVTVPAHDVAIYRLQRVTTPNTQ